MPDANVNALSRHNDLATKRFYTSSIRGLIYAKNEMVAGNVAPNIHITSTRYLGLN